MYKQMPVVDLKESRWPFCEFSPSCIIFLVVSFFGGSRSGVWPLAGALRTGR